MSENNTTTVKHLTELESINRHLTNEQQVVITFFYLFGTIGNVLALIFLCRKSTKPHNAKHRLMLQCLATNDLIAMLGMMIQMYIQLYFPTSESVWFCRFRVSWRTFGLGSGCVAIVMAVERWLALTKPFFYQKHVTLVVVRRSIFTLWTIGLILVCLPFFGFGLYLEGNKCTRYRLAKEAKDIIYAYTYFTIGLILSGGIIFCNLTVMHSLWNKGQTSISFERIQMRRMSRSTSKASNTSTREELAFGRLMGLLCIIFIICWIPQLLTTPIAQLYRNKEADKFFRIADMLMALHFVLDPYVYVLQRWEILRLIFSTNKSRNKPKQSSLRVPSYEQTFLSNI